MSSREAVKASHSRDKDRNGGSKIVPHNKLQTRSLGNRYSQCHGMTAQASFAVTQKQTSGSMDRSQTNRSLNKGTGLITDRFKNILGNPKKSQFMSS